MVAVLARQIDLDAIARQVEQGYINVQKHPTADLRIFNYSQRAQYDWHWTEETKACRGLMLDGAGNIVQRPFPKFFSADQTPRSDLIWSKPFSVTAKMDGSLGILYDAGEGPAIATRGSFTSTQAIEATALLRDKYAGFNATPSLTALFEIILPTNRIVCDYGDTADLYLLTAIDNETGADAAATPEAAARLIGWPGPVVEQYPVTCQPRDVLDALGLPQDGSVEGVVLRFDYPKGLHTRMKVKTDEYKRLHKLLTGVSAKDIWEALSEGKGLDAVLERTPDEFHVWVRSIETELSGKFTGIESQCRSEFRTEADRKSTALYFQTCQYPPVLFSMLDGKDYAPIIWKMIKPKGVKPFRCGDES
jgi:hypothetical protein